MGISLKELAKPAGNSRKYKNIPTEINGIKFASRREAGRYCQLLSLQKAGKIRGLKLQPQYTLQESYVSPEGERVRAVRYTADFAYERAAEPDCAGNVYWLPVVEDVKSKATKTAQYEIKKKLLQGKYGIAVTEV